MVKIFTMVKDEVDIIKDWIIYHGSLFGWNNIYIIDNCSTDGTYETILGFESLGINIFQKNDYRKKGEYMSFLINKYCSEDTLAFPIDIDEFIIYYEPGSKEVKFDKNFIIHYFDTLPKATLYKSNYLMPILTNPNGFNRATVELDYAHYVDYGAQAKTFFNTKYYKGEIDHGNHIPSKDYFLTNIALIHYHDRNIDQAKKKTLNNVKGLGYSTDLNDLHNTLKKYSTCGGNHHIRKLISIHENKFQLPYVEHPDIHYCVSITPFKKRIIDGYF